MTKLGTAGNMLSQAISTVSGSASVYVVESCYKYERSTTTYTTLQISVSGGGYTYNDQYTLTLSKPGYITQTIDYWGSSDQTWTPTLVATSTATAQDVLNILGTPVDWTTGATISDMLKDMADSAGGANYDPTTDSQEMLSNKIDVVEGPGFAPGIDDLEHIANSARNSYYASKTGGKR
jgi:hypothetical protein